MKILFIDLYNMIHRCHYSAFQAGEYSTVFTFIRSFRSVIEKFSPEKIIVVTEGNPKFRHEIYPEYKAQRKIIQDNKTDDEKDKFKRQKLIILDLLKLFPIQLLMHSDYEADDVISSLIRSVYFNDECIIITADNDYLQLLDNENVKIFNPVKKEFLTKPDYDIIKMKSLMGDKSDNISGIPRIGIKSAEKLLYLPDDQFLSWLNENKIRMNIYNRNLRLVTFADVNLSEILELNDKIDFDKIKEVFAGLGFNSITNEKSWEKYIGPFLRFL